MMIKEPIESWNVLPLERLFDEMVHEEDLHILIDLARAEDMGAGEGRDVSSELLIDADRRAKAAVRPRVEGRLAGARLLPLITRRYDSELTVEHTSADGRDLAPGLDVVCIEGRLRSILAVERVMLNFLSRLSGIATLTRQYVDAVEGTGARIYDTRKTLPGYRALSKYAVRCGGGCCHRFGLHDAVLIKDNHIAHIPSHRLGSELKRAIDAARERRPPPAFIEVEVDSLEQLRIVLDLDPDVILLDNMDLDQLRDAAALRDRQRPGVQLESSGGVTLEQVRGVAETGVDRIAVGALTHSAPAMDFGLDME